MDMKKIWRKGDWAAFFGLFTNNLTNLLTMMGLLLFVVGLPKDFVMGQVAPAFGFAVMCASVFYAWFAYKLKKETGRDDVTALPSGPSAPSIFTVTFLVIMPVYQTTQNAQFAIQIALVWCFVEAMILLVGSFFGDAIRRIVPRTVLLSCLAGLGLTLLALNPMLQAFSTPVVSFVVLGLIFINWFGSKPLFPKIPTGLLLILVGTVLAWVFGLQSPEAIVASLSDMGFNPPGLHIDDFIEGIPHALPYLASAVPLGLANYVFDLENIESADTAGDAYPTRKVMTVNGLSSMVGAFLGNPFPVTVYVGHAAYKEMGAGIGYTLFNGVIMFVVSLLGLGALLLSLIPGAAIAPILVYIGIVTANQVVRESPKLEVPAIFVCLFPWVGYWALTMFKNTLATAGTNAYEVGIDALAAKGIYYEGMVGLGNGAPLASLLWGCMVVFAINNTPLRAVVAALIAAFLSIIGFIHANGVGFAQPESMMFVYSYLMLAGLFGIKHFANVKENVTELEAQKLKSETA